MGLSREQIIEKRVKIQERLSILSERKKLLEAKLLWLQAICSHLDTEEWDDGGGYKGSDMSSHYSRCKLCAKLTIS